MTRKSLEKVAAVLSLCLLAASWFAGSMREKGADIERIRNASAEMEDVEQIGPNLFRGHRRGAANETLYAGLAEHPGYAGPVQIAVVINGQGRVESVALVRSTDTSPYLARVLQGGVLDAFLGAESAKLPHIDAVSGATLSSTAVIKGVERAVARIRQQPSGDEKSRTIPKSEWLRGGLVVTLFLLAAIISSGFFKGNKTYARLGLLAISVITLGFIYKAQFSLSSLNLLLAGLWTGGLSSYTPLICLILAVAVFILTRKNLYCTMICPFGGLQEGLGRITGCTPPKRTGWMKWTARSFALTALCSAMYFRNPSDAMYEPFGMAFSFIGSSALFALTVLVVVASLVVRRPWCILFCPVTCLFDYLAFVRRWMESSLRRGRRTAP